MLERPGCLPLTDSIPYDHNKDTCKPSITNKGSLSVAKLSRIVRETFWTVFFYVTSHGSKHASWEPRLFLKSETDIKLLEARFANAIHASHGTKLGHIVGTMF